MNKTKLQQMQPMLIISGIALLIMIGATIYAWVQIPADASVPVHFDINGEPDRYGSAFPSIGLIPMIMVGLIALFAAIPSIDPNGENIMQSRTAYFAAWGGTTAVMLFVHLAIIASVLGNGISILQFLPYVVGLLLIVIGNYMGKIQRNYMFGIRTPWTLASDLSWNKTHRFGGRLMMAFGALILIVTAIGQMEWFAVITVAGAIGLVITLFVYSYMVWKEDSTVQTS